MATQHVHEHILIGDMAATREHLLADHAEVVPDEVYHAIRHYAALVDVHDALHRRKP